MKLLRFKMWNGKSIILFAGSGFDIEATEAASPSASCCPTSAGVGHGSLRVTGSKQTYQYRYVSS